MMSPSSTMRDEMKFQQRWEYRRKDNDFDSSTDDSKSSATVEPVLKKHKLVSGLIALDNDETSNAGRTQPNHHHYDPGFEDQIEYGKAKEKTIKRSKKNCQADSEMKRDSHEEINRKKSKTGAYDPAALDDVKSFTESLLEDLKATTENLFTRMREEINKLVADDNAAPPRKRRRRTSKEKKIQSQHRYNIKKNMKVQHQNSSEKKLQFQLQTNVDESIQEQHLNMQQQKNNFEEDIEVPHQNNSKSGMQAQNCVGGSLEKFVKSTKEAADSNNHCQALDNHVDYDQTTGLIISIEKEKGERLALTANSKSVYSPSNQNSKVQHPKSVVLAIRAQNCNGGSSLRSVAGKKTADSKRHRVSEDRVGDSQLIGSMTSSEKDKKERLRSSVEQKFSPELSDQVASSMYLTLPTILPKAYDVNNRLDTSFCNSIQPRIDGNKTIVNMERENQMPDFSTHCGYHPSIQAEERSGNFAQMGSRNMSCFDQNGTPNSTTGTGFPVPLHQDMDGGFSNPGRFPSENFPTENCNKFGLRLNGGAITFSGGSYALSEHVVANNLHSHSSYKADDRVWPYQIPSLIDGYLFPK